MEQSMKALILAGLSLILMSGQGVSIEQKLMQMERDWGNAQIKKDYAAVDKMLAADWQGIDYDGQIVDKATYMAHMRSEQSTLQSEDISQMKVRVFGNTAVVTGDRKSVV